MREQPITRNDEAIELALIIKVSCLVAKKLDALEETEDNR